MHYDSTKLSTTTIYDMDIMEAPLFLHMVNMMHMRGAGRTLATNSSALHCERAYRFNDIHT